MFSLDSSVGFHGNLSPCKKHTKFLLQKFENSWFVFVSSSFFSPSLFFYIYFIVSHHYCHTWTWLVLFQQTAVLLDPWVQVVGFSRFHLSSDSIILYFTLVKIYNKIIKPRLKYNEPGLFTPNKKPITNILKIEQR